MHTLRRALLPKEKLKTEKKPDKKEYQTLTDEDTASYQPPVAVEKIDSYVPPQQILEEVSNFPVVALSDPVQEVRPSNPYIPDTFLGPKFNIDSIVVHAKRVYEEQLNVVAKIENLVLDYLSPDEVTSYVTNKEKMTPTTHFRVTMPLKVRFALRTKTRFENLFTTSQTLMFDPSIAELKKTLDAGSGGYTEKYAALWKAVEPKFSQFLENYSGQSLDKYVFYDCVQHYCSNNRVGASRLLSKSVCYPEKETLAQFLLSENVKVEAYTLVDAVAFQLPLEIIQQIAKASPDYGVYYIQCIGGEDASHFYCLSYAAFHKDPAVLDFFVRTRTCTDHLENVFAGIEKTIQKTNGAQLKKEGKTLKYSPSECIEAPKKIFRALLTAASTGHIFKNNALAAIASRFNVEWAKPFEASVLEENIKWSVQYESENAKKLLAKILCDSSKQEMTQLLIKNQAQLPKDVLIIALSFEAPFDVIQQLLGCNKEILKMYGMNSDSSYYWLAVLHAMNHSDPRVFPLILRAYPCQFKRTFEVLADSEGQTATVKHASLGLEKKFVLVSPVRLLLAAEGVLQTTKDFQDAARKITDYLIKKMQNISKVPELLAFCDEHLDKYYFPLVFGLAGMFIAEARDTLKNYFTDQSVLNQLAPDEIETYHELFIGAMKHRIFSEAIEQQYTISINSREYLTEVLDEFNQFNPVVVNRMRPA